MIFPSWQSRHSVFCLAMVVICLAPATAVQADGRGLRNYASRHYTIYTDLSREEVLPFGQHMDTVFDQFTARFSSFRSRRRGLMALYLFKSQQGFLDFLAQHQINGAHSAGMFFINPQLRGLASWVRGKSKSETFRTLQHEGFHQFAFSYIGPKLPIWINEGLAVYFESGILTLDRFDLGLADGRRVHSVQKAIRQGYAIDFDDMLNMTPQQWSQNLRLDPDLAQLQYDQAWSMVHFLIHANPAYRKAFEDMLHLVADGMAVGRVFRKAFHSANTAPFRKKWVQFVLKLQPDPINTAISRMEFLGHGLLHLHKNDLEPPKSIHELRRHLQKVRFRAMQTTHNITIQYDSADETVYQYGRKNQIHFKLLEPIRADLLPRIVAPGLRPEPMLVWSFDDDGDLAQEITFR